MKYTPSNAKLVSAVLGVIGGLWLIGLSTSFASLTLHEALLKAGCGLSFISLALEPEILFRPPTLAAVKQPLRHSPAVQVLSLLGAACLLLAGAIWVAS